MKRSIGKLSKKGNNNRYKKITARVIFVFKQLDLFLPKKIIEEKLKKFIKVRGRFFYVVCYNGKCQKFFFKTILTKEKRVRNRFLNEIDFLIAIKNNPKHPLANLVPQILFSSKKSSFPYLVYKFIPENTESRKKENFPYIVRILKKINSSPVNIFNFRPRESFFTYQKYRKIILQAMKENVLKKEQKNKISNFIKNNKKIFKLYTGGALTHGDFSETNIVFLKKQIKIIDWEHVHKRNALYDLALLWRRERLDRKKQKIIIKEYFNIFPDKKHFPNLFKLALLETCLNKLVILKNEKTKTRSIKKEKHDYWNLINNYILSDKKIINSFKDLDNK